MGKNIELQQIRVETPNSNQFDLSFDSKLTLDMGKLYPVLCQETLPGDYYNITPEMMIRLSPMIAPVMHKIDARIHYYFVPYRLLWKNWDKFLAGEDYVKPYIQGTTDTLLPVQDGSFLDYLGLPTTPNMKEKIDFGPIMAYFQIYNNYYQDQNNDPTFTAVRNKLETLFEKNGLITPADLFDGPDDDYSFDLFQCAYEHDALTSCLPFAQKGDAVNIPLQLVQLVGDTTVTNVINGDIDGNLIADNGLIATAGTPPELTFLTGTTTIDGAGAELAGTINQLRTAFATQKFLELIARTGTRYNELIEGTWGEDIGDARINRPQYIGGIKNNVVISEVLQTSQSDEATAQPLGQYAGHGTTYIEGNNVNYKCVEHGFIIGLMSILPKTAYYQGLHPKFTRQSYLDYPIPQFYHIGEESVKNKEVYYDNTLTNLDDDFGYRPRNTLHKMNQSEVHGQMRSSLLYWHLARKFDNQPVLNDEFIYVKNDKRIFAVEDDETDSYIAHIYHNINANRKLPIFSTPSGL